MSKRIKLSEKFTHWDDSRAQTEKKLTKQLISTISDRNKRRVEQGRTIQFKQQQDHLFLLFSGVPPHEHQYTAYKFPGKTIRIVLPGYEKDFQQVNDTQQKRMAYLTNINRQNTIKYIDQIVKQNSKSGKVFIVCHSFGSFIAAMYCQKFPQKVIGFVSIGGPVLKFYSVFKDYVKALFSIPGVNRDFIVQNYHMVYDLYDQEMQKHPTMERFHNAYQHISFIMHNLEEDIDSNFERIRAILTGKLLCFIYGEKDTVMAPALLQQYAAYISFLKPKNTGNLQKDYESLLKKHFQRISKVQISEASEKPYVDIQQYFIFGLQKGPHGVHYTKAFTQRIQRIMNEYIYVVLQTQRAFYSAKL